MSYKNKKDLIIYREKYYQKNREKILKKSKQWRIDNPERAKATRENHYLNNKSKILKQTKQWQKDNPDKRKEISKRYIKNHRLEIYIRTGNCLNYKRKTDLKYSLDHRISESIRRSLKNNKAGRHWEDLVGYNLKDLIKRLEKTMPESYTWQDYLEGKLQIDHIVPISIFNYSKPEHPDFKRCWALENLRLLPARENLIKKAKLEKPFQPALKM